MFFIDVLCPLDGLYTFLTKLEKMGDGNDDIDVFCCIVCENAMNLPVIHDDVVKRCLIQLLIIAGRSLVIHRGEWCQRRMRDDENGMS